MYCRRFPYFALGLRHLTLSCVVVAGLFSQTLAPAANAAESPFPDKCQLRLNFNGEPDQWECGAIVEELVTAPGNNSSLIQDDPQLALIETSESVPSFLDKSGKEWIGSRTGGQFDGRFEEGETVTISLVGELASDVWVTSTTQWNTKQNTKMRMTLLPSGEQHTMYSGTACAEPAPLDVVTHNTCACGADSQSDANKGSNCEWLVDATANSMSVLVEQGDVSLNGTDAVSTWNIVESEGIINCNDDTVTAGDGIETPFAQCTRLVNGPSTLDPTLPTDNCQVVNYTLDTECDGSDCDIELIYGLSGTQDATQFRWLCTFNWTAENLTFVDGEPEVPATICISVSPSRKRTSIWTSAPARSR